MTRKQKRFVKEYMIDLNATQAAIRAGYSPETAYSIASENLRKPEIENYIAKEQAIISARTGVSVDRVLKELARIAFVNADNLIDIETGDLKKYADP